MVKNWVNQLDITRDFLLLLVIGGLYALSVALSNTFVNIFLWKQTGQFIDLAIYNLTVVLIQPFAFIIAGILAKKVDRVVVLRIGIICLALFYIAVLAIGNDASDWLLLLGTLLGAGYGFYWLAYNVLTFEITEPETRDFFNGFFGTLNSAGGMIGPIAAGFIISRFASFIGYFIVFGLSLSFFVLAVVISLFLKRRPSEGKLYIAEVWKERRNYPDWRRVTNAHVFQGLREGVFAFVISVFVFVATASELAIGTYGLVNSGVSFICYALAGKIVKKPYRKLAIGVSGFVLFLSLFLLITGLTYGKLLSYAVLIAVAYPFLLVPYVSLTYDVIGGGRNAGERRVEYIIVREIYLNAGRVFSILLFIAGITFFDEKYSIPILLVLLGAGHALIYFCIRKVDISALPSGGARR